MNFFFLEKSYPCILYLSVHLLKEFKIVVLGAMDTKLLEALYWKGIPVFDMGSHMSTVDVGWGSPTFHKMGRQKVVMIDSLLPYGFELLMCDTDMVWLKVRFQLKSFLIFCMIRVLFFIYLFFFCVCIFTK